MFEFINFFSKKKILKFISADKCLNLVIFFISKLICYYGNAVKSTFSEQYFNTVAKVTKVKISKSSIKCSFRLSKWMGEMNEVCFTNMKLTYWRLYWPWRRNAGYLAIITMFTSQNETTGTSRLHCNLKCKQCYSYEVLFPKLFKIFLF